MITVLKNAALCIRKRKTSCLRYLLFLGKKKMLLLVTDVPTSKAEAIFRNK